LDPDEKVKFSNTLENTVCLKVILGKYLFHHYGPTISIFDDFYENFVFRFNCRKFYSKISFQFPKNILFI
jgi:hypothetical protein